MMLEPATKKKVYPKGQIFVARLYDIVRMYNEIGDSLFEKNVRFSLESDKNDVETSIHSTLENEPDYFWFYNNGITLLADKVNYSDSKSIEIFAVDGNKFSVINGAQTITACADFYYSPFIDEEKIDKAKSAYVMLRIISVYEDKDAQDLDCEEEVEGASRKGAKERLESKISVSLNRQKPIDEEDLAINSETVYMINNIEARLDLCPRYFRVVTTTNSAFCHEVIDTAFAVFIAWIPVLYRRIFHFGVSLCDNLHYSGVKLILITLRGGAAFHITYVSTFISDD